jgi:hypothetical protein
MFAVRCAKVDIYYYGRVAVLYCQLWLKLRDANEALASLLCGPLTPSIDLSPGRSTSAAAGAVTLCMCICVTKLLLFLQLSTGMELHI